MCIALRPRLLKSPTDTLTLYSSFYKNANYGTGNAVDDQRGNSAIRVEKGNSASCKVLCDSADNIEFYIGYSVPGMLVKYWFSWLCDVP